MRLPAIRQSGGMSSSLTPLLDIAFLLLIYFLCTASFAMPEFELRSAVPASQILPWTYLPPIAIQELEQVRISLTQPATELEIELNGNSVADLAALRERLEQLRALAHLPALLEVAPEVKLDHVVAIYDLCLAAGLREVRFATPHP